MFPITRVYSDSNGESHFEDIQIPLHEAGNIGRLSEVLPANGIVFREVEPSYDWNFHTAPQKQYIVLLDGQIEIETSLGEKRTFKAGEILLVEDTTGKGHKTRNIQPIIRKSIFITLP
jgi:quercetin dioxygenase-like cupin family protein